ncbi:MAG: hypothetical protein WB697_09360 [Stellaceae bacterium]
MLHEISESSVCGGRFVDITELRGHLLDVFGVVIEGSRPVEEACACRGGKHPLRGAAQFVGAPTPFPGPVEKTPHSFETTLAAAGSRSFVR